MSKIVFLKRVSVSKCLKDRLHICFSFSGAEISGLLQNTKET